MKPFNYLHFQARMPTDGPSPVSSTSYRSGHAAPHFSTSTSASRCCRKHPVSKKPFHRLLVHTASLAPEVYKVNKNILGIISPLFHCFFFLLNPTVGIFFLFFFFSRVLQDTNGGESSITFATSCVGFTQLHKSDPSNW